MAFFFFYCLHWLSSALNMFSVTSHWPIMFSLRARIPWGKPRIHLCETKRKNITKKTMRRYLSYTGNLHFLQCHCFFPRVSATSATASNVGKTSPDLCFVALFWLFKTAHLLKHFCVYLCLSKFRLFESDRQRSRLPHR